VDGLLAVARRAGALGAKLTGGGAGGAVIALVDGDAEQAEVARAFAGAGATTMMVAVGEE
jgi:mevalonate kinase